MGGDLYVRIKIEKHKTFVRKGADLFIDKKITLLEALTGMNFDITQLDGTKLKCATMPGEVIGHE
jgi:DnaJ family protein A protein 2